jgi:leucyl/phenylalanyl-tRNA---protein transferase
MPVLAFPDPRDTGPEGIVAFGGDLHPDTLRLAYRQGIFPWPHRGLPLLWFCPPMRAVLEFDRLHIPESLKKARRKSRLRFTIDAAFDDVIEGCRTAYRPGQGGTWITKPILRAYRAFHRRGEAHSVEAWDENGDLVGGLYGVDAGGLFGGESMFYREPNASKLALLYLIDHLRARGAGMIDIQQLTPHMVRLGAREVPRDVFLRRLREAQEQGLHLFDGQTLELSANAAPLLLPTLPTGHTRR